MNEELKKELTEMEARIIAAVRQQESRESKEEIRYEKKLHNTKLLLKNYKKFKKHTDQAEFTVRHLIDDELLDMLGEKYEHDEQYIQSIIRTKERTAIMLNHIRKVLEFYEYSTRENETENRRARVLIKAYIENKSQSNIAKETGTEERTVRRDIEYGIKEVAPLMFGVDGLCLS